MTEERGRIRGKTDGNEWQNMLHAPLDPSVWIMGRTTHGRVEPCHYVALGDMVDRWGRGNMTLNLVTWRKLTMNELIKYRRTITRDSTKLLEDDKDASL